MLLELILVTCRHISSAKLLLCYERDFLQWTCVAFLCFVSYNRRARQDKEESCTGQGEPVLRPGPITAWAEAWWDRSRSSQKVKSGQGWNQGGMRTGTAGAITSQRWCIWAKPEEPWLKAALELNRGELALSLSLSSCSSGVSILALNNLLNSRDGERCTPCFGLAKTHLFSHVKTWISLSCTSVFQSRMKLILHEASWKIMWRLFHMPRLSHYTKRCNSTKISLGHHELFCWHTWILKCNIPQQKTRNEIW